MWFDIDAMAVWSEHFCNHMGMWVDNSSCGGCGLTLMLWLCGLNISVIIWGCGLIIAHVVGVV